MLAPGAMPSLVPGPRWRSPGAMLGPCHIGVKSPALFSAPQPAAESAGSQGARGAEQDPHQPLFSAEHITLPLWSTAYHGRRAPLLRAAAILANRNQLVPQSPLRSKSGDSNTQARMCGTGGDQAHAALSHSPSPVMRWRRGVLAFWAWPWLHVCSIRVWTRV